MDAKSLIPLAKEGYNVLLSGKHGTGKTAVINEVFDEVFGARGTSWLSFSAATLDPWVDFIGIPKNFTKPDGQEVFRIIPPEHFTGTEKIEALFFDEINRGEEKTLNAIMELIQFRSINGRKFPHLKCVWAAENPHNDDQNHYSVKPLDPAQKDRFNIQLNVPYKVNREYFVKKYGLKATEVAIAWWDSNKNEVSPRKLDDMLSGHAKGFDISLFTNTCRTTKELKTSLTGLREISKIIDAIQSGDPAEIKSKLKLSNLRSMEKILKADQTFTSSLRKPILDILDEEIQAYLRMTFGITEETLKKPLFTAEMEEFLSFTDKNNTTVFLCDSSIEPYMAAFAKAFSTMKYENYSWPELLQNQLEFRPDEFTTARMKSFVEILEKNSSFLANLKRYIKINLYAMNRNRIEASKSPAFSVISKLLRSQTFCRATRPNKIRVNPILTIIENGSKEQVGVDIFEKIYA